MPRVWGYLRKLEPRSPLSQGLPCRALNTESWHSMTLRGPMCRRHYSYRGQSLESDTCWHLQKGKVQAAVISLDYTKWRYLTHTAISHLPERPPAGWEHWGSWPWVRTSSSSSVFRQYPEEGGD